MAMKIPKSGWRWQREALRFTAALILMLAFGVGGAYAGRDPLRACFWVGPISTAQPDAVPDFDGRAFNFPEEAATYWFARFSVPAGARLVLKGRYARARYQSLNAYDPAGGGSIDSLPDYLIEPDGGAANPFVAGNVRKRGGYRVEIVDQVRPVDSALRAPNTLYASTGASRPREILYRVYVPDAGRDLAGDSGLPKPILVMADGSRLRGEALCNAINDADRTVPLQPLPAVLWQAFANMAGGDPATHPAFEPPLWERFFSLAFAATDFWLGTPLEPNRANASYAETGGLYANLDIRYVYAHLSRRYGPVLVLRGKLPTYPTTENGQPVMGTGQLRYWSICQIESRVTLRTVDCLADHQVTIDAERNDTIVVSRPEDRPANAQPECGVTWLDWGPNGDAAGRPDYGLIVIRNMLPAPDFAEAAQNVTMPGIERDVMGPYLPTASYTTTTDFDALGCGG